MRFVFAYAGITSGGAYDYVEKKKSSLTGLNTEFIGCAHGPRGSPFTRRHAEQVLQKFQDRAARDIDATGFSKTGYAVIYVRADPESTARFEESFFPATLAVAVDWQQEGETPDARAASHQELLRRLVDASKRARNAIEVVHKELKEQSNKTPLLLPLRNFQSGVLCGTLKELQTQIVRETEQPKAHAVLKSLTKAFEHRHPRSPAARSSGRAFCDDRAIEFRAPGQAKHGVPSFGSEHPTPACLLGGFRRLGAPFHAAFHYDAQKNSPRPLKGKFCLCHGDFVSREGAPHLNVAPNDFIRGQRDD